VLPAEGSVQLGEFGLVAAAGGHYSPSSGSDEPEVNCLAWHPKRMHLALGLSNGRVSILAFPKDTSAWLSAIMSKDPAEVEAALCAVTCVAQVQPSDCNVRSVAFLPCSPSRGELVSQGPTDPIVKHRLSNSLTSAWLQLHLRDFCRWIDIAHW